METLLPQVAMRRKESQQLCKQWEEVAANASSAPPAPAFSTAKPPAESGSGRPAERSGGCLPWTRRAVRGGKASPAGPASTDSCATAGPESELRWLRESNAALLRHGQALAQVASPSTPSRPRRPAGRPARLVCARLIVVANRSREYGVLPIGYRPFARGDVALRERACGRRGGRGLTGGGGEQGHRELAGSLDACAQALAATARVRARGTA